MGDWRPADPRDGRSLVEQVRVQLLARITSGVLRPGDRIPSEHELGAAFGVSRATVREAVGGLVASGRIVRRAGVGAFVSKPAHRVEAGLERLDSFVSLVAQAGGVAATRSTRSWRTTADAPLAARLEVQPGAPVLVLERQRTVDGQAAMRSLDYLPVERLPPGFDPKTLKGSLLARLEHDLGRHVQWSRAKVSVTLADAEVAETLDVAPGVPLLVLGERFVDDRGDVVYCSDQHIRTDVLECALVRRRDE
jgi:GntR family transcriptional regulator